MCRGLRLFNDTYSASSCFGSWACGACSGCFSSGVGCGASTGFSGACGALGCAASFG